MMLIAHLQFIKEILVKVSSEAGCRMLMIICQNVSTTIRQPLEMYYHDGQWNYHDTILIHPVPHFYGPHGLCSWNTSYIFIFKIWNLLAGHSVLHKFWTKRKKNDARMVIPAWMNVSWPLPKQLGYSLLSEVDTSYLTTVMNHDLGNFWLPNLLPPTTLDDRFTQQPPL